MVPALGSFVERYGPVEFAIRDAVGEEVTRMLNAREVDFAIAPALTDSGSLFIQPLLSSPMHVVAAPDHPLSGGATWRELAEERFIFVSRNSSTYEIAISAFASAGCFPRRYMETQTAETAVCMAAAGMGVTVLHSLNINEMMRYDVAHAPVTDPERHLSISLIRLGGHPLLSAAAEFWSHLAAAYTV